MKHAKKTIRELVDNGNYPIHIPDDIEESIRLSEQLLNVNSIDYFCKAEMANNSRFSKFTKRLLDCIDLENCKKDWLCVSGSSVLSAFGLRDAKDLDVISLDGRCKCYDSDIHSHNKEVEKYLASPESVIFDPRMFFYFNGLKFLTADLVCKLKNNRGQPKDLIDVGLISEVVGKSESPLKYFTSMIYQGMGYLHYIVKRYFPKPIRLVLRKIYLMIKR